MHARHRGALLIPAIAVSLALTSCASATPGGVPVGTDGHGSSPSVSTPAPSLDSSAHEPHEEDEEHPTEPIPEAGEDSRDDAIATAERVMTAFARPDLSEEQWWAELLPLLSEKGAYAYESTLPANIPVRAVTGAGQILEASTDVMLIVQIPTDAGPYNITLSRGGVDEPWLAERIRPADAS